MFNETIPEIEKELALMCGVFLSYPIHISSHRGYTNLFVYGELAAVFLNSGGSVSVLFTTEDEKTLAGAMESILTQVKEARSKLCADKLSRISGAKDILKTLATLGGTGDE